MANVAQYTDIIKQIMCVYQALIVYTVNMGCNPNQEKECSEQLLKLFSKYNHILDSVMVVLIFISIGIEILYLYLETYIFSFFFRHLTRQAKKKIKETKKTKLKQMVLPQSLLNQLFFWTSMFYTSFSAYFRKIFYL